MRSFSWTVYTKANYPFPALHLWCAGSIPNNVFCLRGTIGERVPATVVGLLSFPECVAIGYERSSHIQLYCECPVERLTFSIVRAESPASERCLSPPPTTAVGSRAIATDI